MNFDIHGIKIKTDKQYFFPEYFLVDRDINPDLIIERNAYQYFDKHSHQKLGLQFWGGNNTLYFESSGFYKHLQKILISDLFGKTTFSFRSYTKRHGIEEIIKFLFQFKLLQKGLTLVHAAGLEKNGQGILISGWPRTGKSSTALSLARKDGYKILGDDMVILFKEGVIYSFPKKAGVFYRASHSLNLSWKERLILSAKYLAVRVFPPLHSKIDRSLRIDLTRLAKVKNKASLNEVYIARKTKGERRAKIDEEDACQKVVAHVLNIFFHNPFAKRVFLAYALLNDENPLYFEEKSKKIIQHAFRGKNCYILRDKEGNFKSYL